MSRTITNQENGQPDFDDVVRALLKVPIPKKKSAKKKTVKKKKSSKRP